MEAAIQDQIASLMYHVSIVTPEQQQDTETAIEAQRSKLSDHLQNAQASHGDEVSAAEAKQKPVTNDGEKIGRNDPCPCGSGKKYKNCCGKND